MSRTARKRFELLYWTLAILASIGFMCWLIWFLISALLLGDP